MRSRVLVDVSEIDVSTSVLGQAVNLPVLVAPSGLHTLAHPEGEVATARGCRQAGTVMILRSGTGRTMADVRAVGALTWFQLYWNHDRERVRSLIADAVDVGCTAVCLTADMPNRPLLGAAMRAGVAAVADENPLYVLPRGAHIAGGVWDRDARLTWRDLEWLRGVCPVPIVVKGIMTAEDARLAHESGVHAIVVSNHGGRALETPWGTLDALPKVADVVSRIGGSDAALRGRRFSPRQRGARRSGPRRRRRAYRPPRGLGFERPWRGGVRDVLMILGRQLEGCMGMVGARNVAELDRTRIRRVSA